MKLGEGLWKTAGPTTYRLYLLDPESGHAALQSVIKDNGALTSFFLRLKIADRKISEVETIVTRKNESNVFAPEKLKAPDPIWAKVVPPAERATPSLIAAAHTLTRSKRRAANISPRRSQPIAIDLRTAARRPTFQENGRPPIICAAQFDAKIFTWIPEVNDRRFPVVDPEHGIVLAIVVFCESGGQPIPGTDQKRRREATLLAEAFKVTGDQIHRINAVMINRPFFAHGLEQRGRSHWLEHVFGRPRFGSIFRSQPDQQIQCEPTPGCVDLSDRRPEQLLLQSHDRRWRNVCAGEKQFHRGIWMRPLAVKSGCIRTTREPSLRAG